MPRSIAPSRSLWIATRIPLLAGALASVALLGGCETEAQNDAVIGGLLGAGAGAIIGNNSGHHGWGGAGIGAAAGALGGYIIGNEIEKDRRDRYYGDRYYDRRYRDGYPPRRDDDCDDDDYYRDHRHPRYPY